MGCLAWALGKHHAMSERPTYDPSTIWLNGLPCDTDRRPRVRSDPRVVLAYATSPRARMVSPGRC